MSRSNDQEWREYVRKRGWEVESSPSESANAVVVELSPVIKELREQAGLLSEIVAEAERRAGYQRVSWALQAPSKQAVAGSWTSRDK